MHYTLLLLLILNSHTTTTTTPTFSVQTIWWQFGVVLT